MEKVFATGTSGTIGQFLPEATKSLNVRLGKAIDLGNISEVDQDSTVIHLAARVGHLGLDSDVSAYDINVEGTLQLAKACLKTGIKKFVFVSTSHVYAPKESPLLETDSVGPISDYGKQKLSAETGLLDIFSDSPEKLVIARVFSILDFGMNKNTLGGRIEEVFFTETGELLSSSQDVRDFLTPKTVANALYALSIEKYSKGVYNISSGTGLTIAAAAEALLSGKNTFNSSFLEPGNSQVPSIVGNNAKIKNLIPQLDLEWAYKS